MVKNTLQEDPTSGQLFVFVNRRRTQLKILYFDRTGYCIWCKKLVQGQFNFQTSEAGKSVMNLVQLKLLLEGIEIKKMRQYKRYYR